MPIPPVAVKIIEQANAYDRQIIYFMFFSILSESCKINCKSATNSPVPAGDIQYFTPIFRRFSPILQDFLQNTGGRRHPLDVPALLFIQFLLWKSQKIGRISRTASRFYALPQRTRFLSRRRLSPAFPIRIAYFPRRNPSMILASACSSVRPRVRSLTICSPAILPMAASWISAASISPA